MSKKAIKKRRKTLYQTGYDIGYDDGIRARAVEVVALQQRLEKAVPELRRLEVKMQLLKSLALIADAAAHAMSDMER